MKNEAMSFLDERIVVDPDICNGKPIIRGKRITVQTILEFLSAGESQEEILRQYPSLEPQDINACLRVAAKLMDHKYAVEMIGSYGNIPH